jgi:hypothetical protein
VNLRPLSQNTQIETLREARDFVRARSVADSVVETVLPVAEELAPHDDSDIDLNKQPGNMVVVGFHSKMRGANRFGDKETTAVLRDVEMETHDGELRRIYFETRPLEDGPIPSGAEPLQRYEYIRSDAGLQYFIAEENGTRQAVVMDEATGHVRYHETAILQALLDVPESVRFHVPVAQPNGEPETRTIDHRGTLRRRSDIVESAAADRLRAEMPSWHLWKYYIPRRDVPITGAADMQRLAAKMAPPPPPAVEPTEPAELTAPAEHEAPGRAPVLFDQDQDLATRERQGTGAAATQSSGPPPDQE